MADALTDILQSVQMHGSVFSRAALSAPWGVESGQLESGIFHAVVAGRPWARLADGEDSAIQLEMGDVVVFPFGDNHLITDGPDSDHRPIAELTTVDSRGMGHLVVDGAGPRTSLICGTLKFEAGEAHPVFSLLPRMIRVSDHDGRMSSLVETLIGLIAEEVDNPVPGSETVVGRLTDVLIIGVLRSYINNLEEDDVGWLGALRDPGLRESVGLMHRRPEHRWTSHELAAAAGLSRSAFFARFKEVLGETPAEYLTRWRIHLATRLLRQENLSVAAVGHRVGYGTEAAFSNAFLRVVGVRPGAYRKAR